MRSRARLAVSSSLALVVAGLCTASATSEPKRPAVGPSITAIEATFDDPLRTTFYDVSLLTPAGPTTNWQWFFEPPEDDKSCNRFEVVSETQTISRAAWHHADTDGCHHAGTEHNGTISVLADNGGWGCMAEITGTRTHLGPSTPPCRKLREPVKPSTPSDGKPQSTKDLYSKIDNKLEAKGARETGAGTVIAGLGAALVGVGFGTSATVVGVPIGAPTAIVGAGLLIIGSVVIYVGAERTATGKEYANMAVDPPDPHYAVVAKPSAISLGHLKLKANGPAALDKAVALANTYIADGARLIALMRVIRTTADRAAGAAKAKATAALVKQRSAFVAYARQAANLIERQQQTRHALAAALGDAKVTLDVSAAGARKAADALAKNTAASKKGSALPGFLYGRLGFDAAAVAKLQQQAVAALRTSGGFSFPKALVDPSLDTAERAAARVLRTWAAAVAKQT